MFTNMIDLERVLQISDGTLDVVALLK